MRPLGGIEGQIGENVGKRANDETAELSNFSIATHIKFTVNDVYSFTSPLAGFLFAI